MCVRYRRHPFSSQIGLLLLERVFSGHMAVFAVYIELLLLLPLSLLFHSLCPLSTTPFARHTFAFHRSCFTP